MSAGNLYGRSLSFPPRIGPDGRWAWSEGPQNVIESIQIVLMTEVGERIMLRPFGAGLGRFLFEPNIAATRRLIEERVEAALRLWEPRIQVRSLDVAEDPADPQQAIITIEYELVATREVERLSLAVNLGR